MDLETFKALSDAVNALTVPATSKPEFEVHLGLLWSEDGDRTCTIYMQAVEQFYSGVRKLRTNTPVGSIILIGRSGADWFIIGALDDYNQWVSFTPAWTNVTLGSGAVNQGWYRKVGNFVDWKAYMLLGTSGQVSGAISMEGPFTLGPDRQATGYCFANDASNNHRTAGVAVGSSSTPIWVSRIATSDTSIGWGTLIPFDWAVGDYITASGTLIVA